MYAESPGSVFIMKGEGFEVMVLIEANRSPGTGEIYPRVSRESRRQITRSLMEIAS